MDAPRENVTRSVPFAVTREHEGEGTDGLTLTGHAAVFNDWTEINSWEGQFREKIAPGAFKKTIRENNGRVRLQFDHGSHPLIGSIPLGQVRRLKEDSHGLFVEARLSDNWLIQPVRDAIADEAIDGMSFRFTVEKDSWDKLDSDLPERTIQEVRLMELGPVVFPAYDTTDVGVRSRQIAQELLEADDDTRREVARALTFGVQISDSDEESGSDEAADDGTSAQHDGTRDDAAFQGTSDERVAAPDEAAPEGTSDVSPERARRMRQIAEIYDERTAHIIRRSEKYGDEP